MGQKGLLTSTHNWEAIILLPVEVLRDEDGAAVIFVDPEEIHPANINAMYGCARCHCSIDDAPPECEGESDGQPE